MKKPVREAIAFATGLGLYQFFLNGEKVGEDEMTPGWTSYRKHLLYQTYDVKNLLKEGTNTVSFHSPFGLTAVHQSSFSRDAS